jgi:hypothetical protein
MTALSLIITALNLTNYLDKLEIAKKWADGEDQHENTCIYYNKLLQHLTEKRALVV